MVPLFFLLALLMIGRYTGYRIFNMFHNIAPDWSGIVVVVVKQCWAPMAHLRRIVVIACVCVWMGGCVC